MNALLFTGGECPAEEEIRPWIRETDFIAAADSGLATVDRLGLQPDLIVGDMDSLPDKRLPDKFPAAEIVRLNPAKDFSDTESALRLLHPRGFSEIILIGGGGGRLDHVFALVKLFDTPFCPSVWLAGSSAAFFLRPGETLRASGLAPGDTVSVFAAGRGPHRITGKNLRWSPDRLPWDSPDYTPGNSLSNWAETDCVEFSCRAGAFVCVFPQKQSLQAVRRRETDSAN